MQIQPYASACNGRLWNCYFGRSCARRSTPGDRLPASTVGYLTATPNFLPRRLPHSIGPARYRSAFGTRLHYRSVQSNVARRMYGCCTTVCCTAFLSKQAYLNKGVTPATHSRTPQRAIVKFISRTIDIIIGRPCLSVMENISCTRSMM